MQRICDIFICLSQNLLIQKCFFKHLIIYENSITFKLKFEYPITFIHSACSKLFKNLCINISITLSFWCPTLLVGVTFPRNYNPLTVNYDFRTSFTWILIFQKKTAILWAADFQNRSNNNPPKNFCKCPSSKS